MNTTQDVNLLAEKYRWSMRAVGAIAIVIAATVHANAVSTAYEAAGFWDRHIAQSVTNPMGVVMAYVFLGLLGLKLLSIPARVMAQSTVEQRQRAKEAQVAKEQREEERAQEERLQQLALDQASQDSEDGLASAKGQLVQMLGSVDQFLRGYEAEVDSSKRVMALQGAQAVLTTLQEKMARHEIPEDALQEPTIVAMAKETAADIVMVGLTGDRIERDLKRLFG